MSEPLQDYLKDLASGVPLDDIDVVYWEEKGQAFAKLKGQQWEEIKSWGMKMLVK